MKIMKPFALGNDDWAGDDVEGLIFLGVLR